MLFYSLWWFLCISVLVLFLFSPSCYRTSCRSTAFCFHSVQYLGLLLGCFHQNSDFFFRSLDNLFRDAFFLSRFQYHNFYIHSFNLLILIVSCWCIQNSFSALPWCHRSREVSVSSVVLSGSFLHGFSWVRSEVPEAPVISHKFQLVRSYQFH